MTDQSDFIAAIRRAGALLNGDSPMVDYPPRIPRELSADQVLVHNHVPPARRQGTRGFRFWLQSPNQLPVERCACGWAPELAEHYRVMPGKEARALATERSSMSDIQVPPISQARARWLRRLRRLDATFVLPRDVADPKLWPTRRLANLYSLLHERRYGVSLNGHPIDIEGWDEHEPEDVAEPTLAVIEDADLG